MKQIIIQIFTLIIAFLMLSTCSVRPDVNPLLQKFAGKYTIETKFDAALLTDKQIQRLSGKLSPTETFTDTDWNNALRMIQTQNYLATLPVFLYFVEQSGERQFVAFENLAIIYFQEATLSGKKSAFEKYRLSYIWQRKAYNARKKSRRTS